MNTLEIMNELKDKIVVSVSKFPHSNVYISTLGGNEYASVLVTIGLDKKETWANGIFENSRYVKFHVDRNHKGIELECFQFHIKNKELKKPRKITGTSEKIMERFEKDLQILEWIK